jgi:hypothetical protein
VPAARKAVAHADTVSINVGPGIITLGIADAFIDTDCAADRPGRCRRTGVR